MHLTFLGVYFRKYTKIEADKLGFNRIYWIYPNDFVGLVGWVMNTTKGTVIGTIQGPSEKLKLM